MISFDNLTKNLIGKEVERPNSKTLDTLSGHAAGEPFEKLVFRMLKSTYPGKIYKQYEYLNDLFLRHPRVVSLEDRKALFDSPTIMFLLCRSDNATRAWSDENPFEEKQNDTADIIYYNDNKFDIIDVKTKNKRKNAQAPNIISSYKLAEMCSKMIDNKDFDVLDIHYVEVEWEEENDISLKCTNAYYADLFKADPKDLYINWAAAMQVQFHVSELSQKWNGTKEQWARLYIKVFVKSAKSRSEIMLKNYVIPYLKYLSEEDKRDIVGNDLNKVTISLPIY